MDSRVLWLGLALLPVAALAQEQGASPAEGGGGRGELLFNIGGCTSCHTKKDGAALAGGDPIKTPFGTFYAPNITPDPEHGLGKWSEADFVRAMQEGVSPEGEPYYPAFPYSSYTHMTADDLGALWGYLKTIPASAEPSTPHDLGFPYNLRFGLWPWRWVYFSPGRIEPDPAHDAAWNRGQYLVLGPGHCAQCHSPRNFAGAIDEDRLLAGAEKGSDGKPVPNLTQAEKGLKGWSEGDLDTLLSLGMDPEGDFVGGEMAKVVDNSTGKLPDDDRKAIVGYLLSLPPR